MEKITVYKANDGSLYSTIKECAEHENKEYPKIEGYTCYGKYYLADKIFKDVYLKKALEMKEEIIFPNGKIAIAHTLSEEELETIPKVARACNEDYWTSTPDRTIYYSHYFVSNRGNICYGNNDYNNIAVRLGFKNPFFN